MNTSFENTTSTTNGEGGPPVPNDLTKTIISLIGAVLVSTILVGNGLIIVLIIKYRKLRTPTNYFIIGMAIADLNVGLVLIVGVTLRLQPQIPLTLLECQLYSSLLTMSCFISIYSLMLVTLDRYLKVVLPLRYDALMNNKTAILYVALVYLYCFIMVCVIPLARISQSRLDPSIGCFYLLSKIFGEIYTKILIISTYVSLATICVMYGHLFYVVHKLQQKRRKMCPPPVWMKAKDNWMKREAKSIKTLFILLGLCIGGWVPILSVLLRESFDPHYKADLITRTVGSYFAFLNSALNPIWYSLRSEQFRSSARRLLFGRRKIYVHTIRHVPRVLPGQVNEGFRGS